MHKLITTIACLICCIVYTQAQNKNNMLSKKEQSIAAISMYAARGNQDSLKVILARGLDCGLPVSEQKTTKHTTKKKKKNKKNTPKSVQHKA